MDLIRDGTVARIARLFLAAVAGGIGGLFLSHVAIKVKRPYMRRLLQSQVRGLMWTPNSCALNAVSFAGGLRNPFVYIGSRRSTSVNVEGLVSGQDARQQRSARALVCK